MKIGLDVGSTTLKCIVLDANDQVVYKAYERHYSQIAAHAAAMLKDALPYLKGEEDVGVAISGSAGMGLAESCGIPFVQEVYATRIAVDRLLPATDVVIELGGEDAKILFLTGAMEVRMNGSCAGGTGAFIDQMATLLNISPVEMNLLAARHDRIYTIASRCGVFAKSDIQSLLNQGARKDDISASIFAAVVNQTIGGLAQGREITGKVVYLGGPLSFLPQLRDSFDYILGVNGICPDNSLYFVALGAAFSPLQQKFKINSVIKMIENYSSRAGYNSCEPLFTDEDEYRSFCLRQKKNAPPAARDENYRGEAFLGVDSGSTTVKAVVMAADEGIIKSCYLPNNGDPVALIKDFLTQVYQEYPNISIAASAVTGYGEPIVKKAFCLDFGVVETMAHFLAAKKFQPQVDFIIDIGGQDIKCFKIKNGAIDNIFLNEACSSGCGSFLQTFAGAWGYSVADFAKLGLFADKPVDLGSRCTVFMNSSVKQAQKDGASIENISAGLSVSVVKNAIYKVIRANSPDELGNHIVVQGGTFLNDAVLRSFEKEIGREVVRPAIAGLMGAYGAALYAKAHQKAVGSLLNAQQLKQFSHEVKMVFCQRCPNHCRLTINNFDNGRRYIGGNRCNKGAAQEQEAPEQNLNLYEYKRQLLAQYRPQKGRRGRIGIPMGLNFYELLPFWHTLFGKLGFEVVTSPPSTHQLYLSGQHTIPSDTVCYPAKLMHGHIEALIEAGVDAVFYPCLTYNLDEKLGDNHYNCPVVAYYPEVLAANMPGLKKIRFINDYLGLHRPQDFTAKLHKIICREFAAVFYNEVDEAVKAAFAEYNAYMERVRQKGAEFMRLAKEKDLPVIILAGRPYHIDAEINYGIDHLVSQLGVAVLTEDSVSHLVDKFPVGVLNQWTYHARLYAAAQYVAKSNDPKLNLVQLVSFGCGVDAVTTDEVRSILEGSGKIYTQIKIDEIANLGAVQIRLRSLFAALEQ